MRVNWSAHVLPEKTVHVLSGHLHFSSNCRIWNRSPLYSVYCWKEASVLFLLTAMAKISKRVKILQVFTTRLPPVILFSRQVVLTHFQLSSAAYHNIIVRYTVVKTRIQISVVIQVLFWFCVQWLWETIGKKNFLNQILCLMH